MPLQLLRRPVVESLVGLRHSALYQRISDGLLTKPVKLGLRTSAWPAHEIDSINRALVSGADDNAIRALVDQLHAKRTELAQVL